MKLITLFTILVMSSAALAQGVYATAPGRTTGIRRLQAQQYYDVQSQPQYTQGYTQPAQQPNYQVDDDNQYPQQQQYQPQQQQCAPQQNTSLNVLKQACAQWDNHPHRRTGQLADMKIKLICQQKVIVSARVESKVVPAYDVTSAPTQTDRPWVKEVTCQEVAQANYDIVQLCGAPSNEVPNYPPPSK